MYCGGPELVPGTVHVSFVVDEVALGQVFLRLMEFAVTKMAI
jgi:hypothetical protein